MVTGTLKSVTLKGVFGSDGLIDPSCSPTGREGRGGVGVELGLTALRCELEAVGCLVKTLGSSSPDGAAELMKLALPSTGMLPVVLNNGF